MAKKDFTQIDTNPVYSTIAEATAPAEPQEGKPANRARKEYTEQEIQEFRKSGKTRGRKGAGMHRFNMAIGDDVSDYVETMSKVQGKNMTQFINDVLRQHMKEHGDLYKKAKEFRDALESL